MIPRYRCPRWASCGPTSARSARCSRSSSQCCACSPTVASCLPTPWPRSRTAHAWIQPRIADLERTTDHDVIAFVSRVAETVGDEGRWLHYGLTSSDVVDTALALQCRAAGDLLAAAMADLIDLLASRAGSTPGP